jgi:hypothetical protein
VDAFEEDKEKGEKGTKPRAHRQRKTKKTMEIGKNAKSQCSPLLQKKIEVNSAPALPVATPRCSTRLHYL